MAKSNDIFYWLSVIVIVLVIGSLSIYLNIKFWFGGVRTRSFEPIADAVVRASDIESIYPADGKCNIIAVRSGALYKACVSKDAIMLRLLSGEHEFLDLNGG